MNGEVSESVAREVLAMAKERLKAVGVALPTRRRGESLQRFLDRVEALVERWAKKIENPKASAEG